MTKYYGSKTIYATEKNLGDYNKFRGWTIPENEDPLRPGYMVQYEGDGYISWSPKEVFESAYRRVDALTFGQAVEAAKAGKKVARSGWNGKNMFLYYVPENSYPAITEIAKEAFGEMVPYGAYIAMKTAQGNVVPWLASQTDVLGEDWCIID